MRIDLWSDVVCPWCWIGKRRLATALADFPHADEVEVVHHSFELDPAAGAGPKESVVEHLGRKYGGGEAGALQMIERVQAVAADEGLDFRLVDAIRASTRDAHRLLHLALAEGGAAGQAALKERLLAAHFTETEDVSDHAVLTRLAADAGLSSERVAEVLGSEEYDDAVEADIRQAAAYGATGVPFFVIDGRYGVSGAQPAETFRQVLDRAWSDNHPAVEMVGDDADGACGPDGCAV